MTLPSRILSFKVHLLSREKSAPDNGFYSLFILYDEMLWRFGLIYRQSSKCFQIDNRKAPDRSSRIMAIFRIILGNLGGADINS